MGSIPDRFIGGNVPGVDHIGTAVESFALEDRIDHRVRLTVRVGARDIGADGPATIELFDIGRHPQHIALFVHALENGAGATDQFLDLVDHRTIGTPVTDLSQPLTADHHLRQVHGSVLFSVLVDRLPGYRLFVEGNGAGSGHHLLGNFQIVSDRLAHRFVNGLAHQIDTLRHLARFIHGLLVDNDINLFLDHAFLKQNDTDNRQGCHQNQSDAHTGYFCLYFHSYSPCGKNSIKWAEQNHMTLSSREKSCFVYNNRLEQKNELKPMHLANNTLLISHNFESARKSVKHIALMKLAAPPLRHPNRLT